MFVSLLLMIVAAIITLALLCFFAKLLIKLAWLLFKGILKLIFGSIGLLIAALTNNL